MVRVLVGCNPDELVGDSVRDVHPEKAEPAADNRSLKHRENCHWEVQYLAAVGELVDVVPDDSNLNRRRYSAGSDQVQERDLLLGEGKWEN